MGLDFRSRVESRRRRGDPTPETPAKTPATEARLSKRLKQLPPEELYLLVEAGLMDVSRLLELYRSGRLTAEDRPAALLDCKQNADLIAAALGEILTRN